MSLLLSTRFGQGEVETLDVHQACETESSTAEKNGRRACQDIGRGRDIGISIYLIILHSWNAILFAFSTAGRRWKMEIDGFAFAMTEPALASIDVDRKFDELAAVLMPIGPTMITVLALWCWVAIATTVAR